MDIATLLVLEALVGVGLLGFSLWWYRRSTRETLAHTGRVLWTIWVAFFIVSLIILAVIGPEALLLIGGLAWAFSVVGTVLGSRLLARYHWRHDQDIWGLTLAYGLGSLLLGLLLVWSQVWLSMRNP